MTHNNERNELAETIHSRICEESLEDCLEWRGKCLKAAEEALAAGYVKPRQVTTVEELDATIYAVFEDGGYLVLSDRGARPWIIWSDEDGDEVVNSWPQEDDSERLTLTDISLPVTVLHVGSL